MRSIVSIEIFPPTFQGLALAVSAQVMFNSKTNKIFLQHVSVPETKREDIGQFLLRIADAIRQSARREIPRDEQDKILRVIRVLLKRAMVVKPMLNGRGGRSPANPGQAPPPLS